MLPGATRAQRRVADRYHRVRANPTDPLAFGVIGERPDDLSIVRRLVWFYLALPVGLGPTTNDYPLNIKIKLRIPLFIQPFMFFGMTV